MGEKDKQRERQIDRQRDNGINISRERERGGGIQTDRQWERKMSKQTDRRDNMGCGEPTESEKKRRENVTC